jgi:glycosyltransferase involved in cell wall biosynthesis
VSIAAVLVVKNEEKRLKQTLNALKWVDEIVVVDSGSIDKTVDIARNFTDKVYLRPWAGYGKQKNFALSKVNSKWVFSIDADEIVTKELAEEIKKAIKNDEYDGYLINTQLVFLGKPLRFGGVYPDYHLRLFKRGKGTFVELEVHEKINLNGKKAKLSGKILHYSYENLYDYLRKFNNYTTLFAKQEVSQGKKVNNLYPFLRFGGELFKRFILKLAILDGYPGILYAFLSSFYSFMKYAKLYEMEK